MGPLSPDGRESEWMAGEHVGGNKRPVATQLEPCLAFDAENRGVKVKVGAGRARRDTAQLLHLASLGLLQENTDKELC